jgi:hypothetical protein
MHGFPSNIQPNQCLSDDLKVLDILPGELWMYYFSMGGLAKEPDVRAYLDGTLALPPWQCELLEHAYKELIFHP